MYSMLISASLQFLEIGLAENKRGISATLDKHPSWGLLSRFGFGPSSTGNISLMVLELLLILLLVSPSVTGALGPTHNRKPSKFSKDSTEIKASADRLRIQVRLYTFVTL